MTKLINPLAVSSHFKLRVSALPKSLVNTEHMHQETLVALSQGCHYKQVGLFTNICVRGLVKTSLVQSRFKTGAGLSPFQDVGRPILFKFRPEIRAL